MWVCLEVKWNLLIIGEEKLWVIFRVYNALVTCLGAFKNP